MSFENNGICKTEVLEEIVCEPGGTDEIYECVIVEGPVSPNAGEPVEVELWQLMGGSASDAQYGSQNEILQDPLVIPSISKSTAPKTVYRNTYKCPQCDYSTKYRFYLKKHIMYQHTCERPYKCSYCPYRGAEMSAVKKHINVKHHKIKDYKCPHCDFKGGARTNLREHLRYKHSDERPYLCSECDYAAKRATDLRLHFLQLHTERNLFPCSFCDYKSNVHSVLLAHIRKKHEYIKGVCKMDDDRKILTQDRDSTERSSFAAKGTYVIDPELINLGKGDNRNNEESDIETCEGSVVVDQGNEPNESLHDIEYPAQNSGFSKAKLYNAFSCDKCDYSSKSKNFLAQHINKMHCKPKPFKCKICEFSSTDPGVIQRHVAYQHTNKKKFSCTSCDFKGETIQALRLHITFSHPSEKTYKCSLCGFNATCSTDLRGHVLVKHTKKALYPCPHCDYQSNVSSILDFHMRKRHSKGPTPNAASSTEKNPQNTPNVSQSNPNENHSSAEGVSSELILYEENVEQDTGSQEGRLNSSSDLSCPHCNFIAESSASLNNHISLDHPNVYKCGLCDFCSPKLTVVQKHIMAQHCDTDTESNKPSSTSDSREDVPEVLQRIEWQVGESLLETSFVGSQ